MADYLYRQQFSGSQWAERIVVPQPVRLNRHESSEDGANTDVTPHADVLVETYEPGVSMIKVINSIDVPAAASRGSAYVSTATSSAASTITVWREHDKEIAALGLDAILKMVSATYIDGCSLLYWYLSALFCLTISHYLHCICRILLILGCYLPYAVV